MFKFFTFSTVYVVLAYGQTTTPHETTENSALSARIFPYHVSLTFYEERNRTYTPWCSGSIISNKWIITAGSCFDKRQWSNTNASLIILTGSAQLKTAARSYHRIHEKIYYWWYFMNQFGIAVNDIILVSVAEPFEFSRNVQPVQLYDQDEQAVSGSNAIVSGWASVENFKNLKNLNVSIISKYECNILHHGGITYTGQICAVYQNQDDRQSCPVQSDPGSPLVINGRLAGILSWGTSSCAFPDEASIYTEVGYFRDWIRNMTGV